MYGEYSSTSKRETKTMAIILELRDFYHHFPYCSKTKIAEISIPKQIESHHIVNVTNTS